ncbi:methyltransferase domain-containing protein [Agrococcus sp. Ld7]|uniref:methyltransferase domain-containing protein n=1 Tax=Agrococcus sp. Ld7 TaxID=649148 RepID=UPI003867CFF2
MTAPVPGAIPRPPRRPDLAIRERVERELMDDPDCDVDALHRTYALFQPINRLVAGWRRIYTRQLRPALSPTRATTLLDIGSGGGDVPRALAAWAVRDGLLLDVTAIDPDERAHDFASALDPVPNVRFRRTRSADLVAAGERFDIVTSNHLLHHLDQADLAALLADSERLARRLVVHNDIARSGLAYAAYRAATTPLARRSFAHFDGSLSIRRSYRAPELRGALRAIGADGGWCVDSAVPFRVLLRWTPPRGQSHA